MPDSHQETESNANTIEPNALIDSIEQEVLQAIRQEAFTIKAYIPPKTDNDGKTGQSILYNEELDYMNVHWNDWAVPIEINSHRPFIGKYIVALKKWVLDYLWDVFFKRYFEREREFQLNLIRHLNDTAKYIDSRNSEIFWELVEKIDSDIGAVNERNDRLYELARAHSESRIAQLEQSIENALINSNKIKHSVALEEKIRQERYRHYKSYFAEKRGAVIGEITATATRENYQEIFKQLYTLAANRANGIFISINHLDPGVIDSIALINAVERVLKETHGLCIIECADSLSHRDSLEDELIEQIRKRPLLCESRTLGLGSSDHQPLHEIEQLDYLPQRFQKNFEQINENFRLVNNMFAPRNYYYLYITKPQAKSS